MSLLSNVLTRIAVNLRGAAAINRPLLVPAVFSEQQTAGFKQRGWLKRRCKDCFFVRREDRLYVICKTHGRHKQMQMVKDPKNTWMLSHATQGKIRAW